MSRKPPVLVLAVSLLLIAPLARGTSWEMFRAQGFFSGEPLWATVFNWSLFNALRQAEGNGPPTAADPVVTATGEYFTTKVDLDLGGPLPLLFGRHYGVFTGQAANYWGFHATGTSLMGANWVHNHQLRLMRRANREVGLYVERGKVLFFRKSSGVWNMIDAPGGLNYMGTPYQMVQTGTKLEMMDPLQNRILRFEFDSLVNGEITGVETVRDRNGNTHTYSYNGDDTLAQVADGLGRTLNFTYVVSGGFPRVKTVTDQSGRLVNFVYTSAGYLRRADSARGTRTKFTYDGNARMLTLTRPEANISVTNTYNGSGKCTSQTDGEGNVWTFAYPSGKARITDPLGNIRLHEFDGSFRLIRWTDEAGRAVNMSYDGQLRLLSTTDRLGATTSMTYHAGSGSVASRTDASGNTWSYTYSPQVQDGFTFYELTRIDLPDATSASFTYDAQGNVLSSTDRRGKTQTWTYNSRGQALTVTNAEGGKTTVTYDAGGNLASLKDPAGNQTTYSYDLVSRRSQISRADASTVSITYDANNNILSRTDENGNDHTWTYDLNDNLISSVDPLGNTSLVAYDGNDDPSTVTDPLGSSVQFAYDGLRQLVTTTDSDGDLVRRTYDTRRRLASIIDADGQVTSFKYDKEAVIKSLTDPSGTWSYDSDVLGRITSATDPLGESSTFEYDAFGRLTRTTNANGESTDTAYDEEGLVSRIAMPMASGGYRRNAMGDVVGVGDPRGNRWKSRFDDLGRLTREIDPLGNVTTYQHDNRNRAETVTLPGGLGTLDLDFDPASRLTRLLFSDGTDLQFSYDNDDRLVSANGISMAYDASDNVTDCNGLDMTYDSDRRLETLTLAPGKTVTYTYDSRDLVTSVADWVGGTTSLSYDASGRVSTIARPNGLTTYYDYDSAGRLVSIREDALWNIELTRDARGQVIRMERRLPASAAPALGNRAFSFDDACQESSYVYDALGRLADDGQRQYTWDLASRLKEIDPPGASTHFTYDATGLMLSRTDGNTQREFVWNHVLGLPSISVVRSGGQDLRYYVHTPDGMLLHSVEATNNQRRFFHFDQVGSTVFLTSDGSVVTDTYAYAPYGELLAHTGTTENPFTWHGQVGVMQDTGLYSMRARWYDPVSMRFLSRDPIRGTDPVRINPYQAMFGDPIALVDPTGLDPTGSDPSDITLGDAGGIRVGLGTFKLSGSDKAMLEAQSLLLNPMKFFAHYMSGQMDPNIFKDRHSLSSLFDKKAENSGAASPDGNPGNGGEKKPSKGNLTSSGRQTGAKPPPADPACRHDDSRVARIVNPDLNWSLITFVAALEMATNPLAAAEWAKFFEEYEKAKNPSTPPGGASSGPE